MNCILALYCYNNYKKKKKKKEKRKKPTKNSKVNLKYLNI